MSRTNGDSKGFDIVCMSFGKENERGIKVISSGEKDSFLSETMEIKATNCRLEDMNFTREQLKTLEENRKNRKATRTKTTNTER